MPHYLAPEQLRHRKPPAEPTSDLYALGILAFELLTGRCPVKGGTREEIAAKMRRRRPGNTAPSCRPPWKRWCCNACARVRASARRRRRNWPRRCVLCCLW
ncbi:MAG: hypothetical protein EXR98_08925 [Gemmataceae bacterium]|nr:hypothetical protein [Gemmataceae bacterium]